MKKPTNRLVTAAMLSFAGAVSLMIGIGLPAAAATSCGPAFCPNYYAAVKCPNGKIYTNWCFAARACQTNCTPIGGPVP